MRHVRSATWLLVHLTTGIVMVALASAEPPASTGTAPIAKATDSSPSAASAADPDAVLVSWNGGELRVRDWLAAYATKLPQQQELMAKPAGRLQLLRDLERYALLVQEARRRGYEQNAVVMAGAEKAAIDSLSEHVLAVAPETITDAEVAAEYERKRARYRRPALRRASQIVVANEADAKALLRELRGATRERFGSVARERSKDEATRKQSGELGWFTREGNAPDGKPRGLPKAIVDAVYGLPRTGTLVPRAVPVSNGFAVVLMTGTDVQIEQSLADVAGELREEIAARKSDEALEQLVTQLRATVPIELHPELVGTFVLDTKPSDIPQGFPPYPEDPRVGPKQIKPDKY